MDISPKSCRICLSETEFNSSLFGSYCRRSNMVDKILVCLKIAIEETDMLNTICYKCAENVENYYNFTMFVKKSQAKLMEPRRNIENVNRRVTSYVREQVYDADYTFSFLEIPNNEEKKETKCSSPFFSYFSPPNVLIKQATDHVWKTPRPRTDETREVKRQRRKEGSRHHSRDLFESQSQDIEEPESKSLDWNLTPDDNIIKRVRDKCFGRSEF